MAGYAMVQDELCAAYLGADIAQLDALSDAQLDVVISARFAAAVDRNVDPHDDAAYLRAILVRTGRDGFRAGRLTPLRIKPFGI